MDIRVAIFEDKALIRAGLAAIINDTEGFICCGAFEDGRQWQQNINNCRPDIILMDIELPGLDGIELTRLILQVYPDVKILVQTVFDDSERIFHALCAGASGYILKTDPPQKILDSIKEITLGGAPMNAAVARKTLAFFKNNNVILTSPGTNGHPLTEREEEILRLLTGRHGFRDIAEKLFISYDTVKTHIKHIYKKLQVSSRSEAIQKAIQQGFY